MDIDSANHFNVRRIEGNVCFSLIQKVEGKSYELRGELDPALAANLAAWLALLSDPAGHEFCHLYNEIKKP